MCGRARSRRRRRRCRNVAAAASAASCTAAAVANFRRIEALRLGALRSRALRVWLLDCYADLALIEELRAIGVFVDVRLLAGGQIGRILEIVEQEFVERAAFFIQNLDRVAISVVNGARVYDSAKRVGRLRVARPFMIHLLADRCELNRLTRRSAFENLKCTRIYEQPRRQQRQKLLTS